MIKKWIPVEHSFVAPRMRRVSRNDQFILASASVTVAPRMRRVSRNISFDGEFMSNARRASYEARE